MKILYITTALDEESYSLYLKEGKPLNNPSNQNFHSRLINLLKGLGEVSLIRIITTPIPTPKGDQGKEVYVPYEPSRFKKMFSLPKGIVDLYTDSDIIFFDSLSYRASKLAKKMRKKRKIPAIAIVTDNPKNLSKTSYLFQKAFLSSLKHSDGAIAVNPKILSNLNYGKKAYASIGFLDEEKDRPRLHDRPYFYYGGTLLEAYGAPALIKAFSDVPSADYDLLIAGHHNESISSNDHRIKFLGQVSKEDNLAYESHASLLINPRPYVQSLDEESTPSKMIEYLSSGSPILSTPSTILKEEFEEDVNWIKGSNVYEEMKKFLEDHLSNGKLMGIKENRAKNRLYSKYGNEAQVEALRSFIEEIISSSSKSMTLLDS